MTNKGFLEIQDVESLDRFLAETVNNQPAILFKHSNSCGISARAHREMAAVERPVGIVTVQKARAVSEEIERRFGLSHETPQVLIVRNGEAVWNASHGEIRAQTVEKAIETVNSERKAEAGQSRLR
jgi:bacillithiol system protein YtxJ